MYNRKKATKKIIKKLQEVRTQDGLSQREMAKILDLGENTYHRWERGTSTPALDFFQILRLVRYLESKGVNLIGLIEEVEFETGLYGQPSVEKNNRAVAA